MGLKGFVHIIISLFIALMLAPKANAEGSAANIGIAYGLSVPDSENTNPRHMFGITGSAYLGSSFSFGGYYYVTGTEEGANGRKFNYSIHGLKALFHLGSGGSGETYFGVMTGITKLRTSSSNTEFILSPYHYGFISGHDIQIWSWLSVGFEGFFVRVQDYKSTNSGVTYREDPFDIIAFLGTLKLHF